MVGKDERAYFIRSVARIIIMSTPSAAPATTRFFADRKYALPRFDMARINHNNTILVVGRRGSGKSTLIKDILWHRRRTPRLMCMSGTEESNLDYQNYVPSMFVYDSLDMDALRRYIACVQQKSDEWRRGERKERPDSGLLLDDVMYDRKPMRSVEIRRLLMNGRHWNVLFILAMQYCMDIDPALRTQIDYMFVFKDHILKNRKRLWENYFGMIPDFGDFCRVFDECTAGYGCLVACNISGVKQQLYWYEAELHDRKPAQSLHIGSAAYWQYAATRPILAKQQEAAGTGVLDLSPLTPAQRRAQPLRVVRVGKDDGGEQPAAPAVSKKRKERDDNDEDGDDNTA